MTAATVTSMRWDIGWLSQNYVGPLGPNHKTSPPCGCVMCLTQRLQLHLPQLGLDLAGVPDRVETAQVKPGDGGLVRIRHAVPALGARAIDERVLVGDEKRFVAVAEFRLGVAELDV